MREFEINGGFIRFELNHLSYRITRYHWTIHQILLQDST